MSQTYNPLSGKALILRLQTDFDHFDFSTIKTITNESDLGFTIIYKWCHGISEFIRFMESELKMSVGSSYHDAMKYLINRLYFDSQGLLEVNSGKKRIDLIIPPSSETNIKGVHHEIKTFEFLSRKSFRQKMFRYL
jgi:hypothetical protein